MEVAEGEEPIAFGGEGSVTQAGFPCAVGALLVGAGGFAGLLHEGLGHRSPNRGGQAREKQTGVMLRDFCRSPAGGKGDG